MDEARAPGLTIILATPLLKCSSSLQERRRKQSGEPVALLDVPNDANQVRRPRFHPLAICIHFPHLQTRL